MNIIQKQHDLILATATAIRDMYATAQQRESDTLNECGYDNYQSFARDTAHLITVAAIRDYANSDDN